MKTAAAILVETGKPLEIGELEIPVLKPGQLLVEIKVSGVCHTQLLEAGGLRGEDKFLPHCLGHEGVGVVQDIGPNVSKVKPGERVILSWIKGSGADVPGSIYQWGNRKVNAGAITTFGRFSVVSENRVTGLNQKIPPLQAALLGCAVPTGMGAVMNAAQLKAGESCLVFGLGGVGLCAVAAAANMGCNPIIAVDRIASKKDPALKMGATHFFDANQVNIPQEILKILPKGADAAIEATGQVLVMRTALQMVRSQGGRTVVVGNAPFGSVLEIDPQQLNMGKKLLGTWGGDSQPDVDFPKFSYLMATGRIKLELLTEQVYPLEKINEALKDLKSGRALRPLIQM
ncbi:MAG: NDMA-dependent alcohol dehydrogenase [Elusimicrobia bacterium]|nr:NDMA-dependent alcohol dehydrogenase [Elusimicrobiota bacterium]